MKCIKCSQEIIDNKDFCPNCGTKLKKEEVVFSSKKIIIIFLIILFITTGIIFAIMFGGTEKEIEPYLKDDTQENSKEIDEISNYFGSYYISDVKITKDTPDSISEIVNDFIGWNVDFYSDKVKFPLYKVEYILIKNPSVYKEEIENFKNLFEGEITNILIKGNNNLSINEDKSESLNFIIFNKKLYAYYSDILFELKKHTQSYEKNDNFYKVNLISLDYSKEINEEISIINNQIKNSIESEGSNIIFSDYSVFEEENIKHIFLEKFIGVPNGHAFNKYYNITYNSNTLKKYNIEEYLNYKKYNIEDIKTKFNNEKQRLYNEQQDFIDKVEEYNKDIFYYVLDGVLYIKFAEGEWGDLFVEINL